MKRLLLALCMAVFLLPSSLVASTRFSLLTCSPGSLIYELFGHTGIRYTDDENGVDLVFNYGIFDFNKPNFIYRYVSGETDYELGIGEYRSFAYSYSARGSYVYEQVLNLSEEEKQKLLTSLMENYRPENRVYRYNYFYNNCSTQARDIIEKAVSGEVVYEEIKEKKTFRDIVHQYTAGHPWSEFGIDFCIGSEADKPIPTRLMMFAPLYMMDEFNTAQVHRGDSVAPLVVAPASPVVMPIDYGEKEPWLPHPAVCAWGLLVVFVALGWVLKSKSWISDSLLFLVAGLCGCVIAFLVMFSVHPAVSPNYLLMVFHPFHVLGAGMIIFSGVKGKRPYYHYFNMLMIAFFLVSWPFLPQKINMAILPLALLLLIRSVSVIYNYRRKEARR